ncbi:M20 family metallopeptidase [Phytomonospora endophytica]|uniref:Glutamate carboxypeptidase n=1 Tax=Phytomonospora endophytica TaxID=714109 RepID=A0A841FHY8_9ACTN|nr:M20 family metallopeptidase [Phytomonospora endophytica]MBB6033468.1 glutamate carboxypeptidase [Phytomonospora endophytica]GIG65013.1 peptidase M20 [Phytomonospora endophytica]
MDIDIRAVRDWAAEHEGDMLADLRTLVECETPSDDLDALRGGLALVGDWITERLGAPDRVETTPGGGTHGDAVRMEYGTGTPTLILGHYDTVWPVGTLVDIPFSIEGDVIRGPGVFDMKAGLVQGVWALRAFDALGLARPPVRLMLNGDEELGSPVSRAAIEAACEGVREVLVLEPSVDGKVKTARKGIGGFHIDVTGVEAHAGLDPTAGASAITALSRIVLQLTGAADLDAGTSVNVGLIDGGSRLNVTAGHAHAGAEIRVRTRAEAERIEAVVANLDPGDARVTVAAKGEWRRPVMDRTPAIGALYERARALAVPLGLDLGEAAVGGASDGNFAAATGRPVLDGLGAVGAGAHARDEYATVSGLIERCALTTALLGS